MEPSACHECPQIAYCEALDVCIDVLRGESERRGDRRTRRRYRSFRRHLNRAGFGYPHAREPCTLSRSQRGIRDLVRSAADSIESLTRDPRRP